MKEQHPQLSHYIYLILVGVIFVALTVIFVFLPRPTFSELEKRELAKFPDISEYSDNIGQYPADISTWFSDSEPFRDTFLGLSMTLRGGMGMHFGSPDEVVRMKNIAASDDAITGDIADEGMLEDEDLTAAGNPLADASAKKANKVIVIGSGKDVRAVSAFRASPGMADPYIEVIKDYVKSLPGIKIYSMVIPTSGEFYLPDKAKTMSSPQKPVIDYIGQNLPAGAIMADPYPYLAAHTTEPIYLRTDHHWAPLGAFYGAKAFAKAAGVPFKELDSYEPHTIRNFVGSMYAFSKDIAVKNAPEDFTYYTPKGLNYKSVFTPFKTSGSQVTAAGESRETEFFKSYPDGSGNAYLTFMGGDQNLVKITTSTPSNRKLLIIKDSYGNALPGYLFYSFGEIYVVDFRYFPNNLAQYAKQNGITDILFAFNIFNAVTGGSVKRMSTLLHQENGSFSKAAANSDLKENTTKPKDSVKPVEDSKEKKETKKQDKQPKETAKPEKQTKEEPEAEVPLISD